MLESPESVVLVKARSWLVEAAARLTMGTILFGPFARWLFLWISGLVPICSIWSWKPWPLSVCNMFFCFDPVSLLVVSMPWSTCYLIISPFPPAFRSAIVLKYPQNSLFTRPPLCSIIPWAKFYLFIWTFHPLPSTVTCPISTSLLKLSCPCLPFMFLFFSCTPQVPGSSR